MTRPIVRCRRSGQCAIDRLQRPEYFRSAIDRYIESVHSSTDSFQDCLPELVHWHDANVVYPHLPFTSPVVYCYTTKQLYDKKRPMSSLFGEMVLVVGFELTTYCLQGSCSTPELNQHYKLNLVNGSVFTFPLTKLLNDRVILGFSPRYSTTMCSTLLGNSTIVPTSGSIVQLLEL